MSFGGPSNSVVRDFVGGVRAASYWIGNRLLSASDIVNDSSVTGATVKAALNTLSTPATAIFPFVASGLAERDLVSYDASAGTWRNRPVHGALSGTGTSAISIGGSSNAKGTHDISIGSSAGSSAATVLATENIAFGFVALNSITDGNYNIGIGKRAGQLITTGNGNTIISQSVSAQGTVSGSNNTITGYLAASSASADENSFFGYASGGASVGSRNLAAGSRALNSASAAVTDCVALGYNALTGVISSTAPAGSVAIGSTALQAATTGFNSAVGFAAGLLLTIGTGNALFGANAGDTLTMGNNNTILGHNADVTANSRSGTVVIGTGASAAADDTLVIRMGNTSTKEIVITPVVNATPPAGAVTYLPITIGGTSYRILLQAP